MGSGVPLLNEYKQEFLWKRLPQTVLGGPKLRLGYDAPAYVYISQVLLFLVPWVVGGTLTPLVHYGIITYDVGIYIIGAVICVYVLAVNGLSAYTKRQQAAVSAVTRTAQNVLAEEDEIEFTGCCRVEAITFSLPGKKFAVNIVLHALLSAALCGLGFWYLLPQTLNPLYSSNLGVTLTLHILGWFALCVAQYSLTVGAPPEPATYNADDTYELAPLMRPFYCLLCFAVDLLSRYYSSSFTVANQVVHVVFVTLPLLWTVGLLSPLSAFLPWLVEQTTVFVFGGSAMASDLRSLVMLVVSVGGFLLVYFVPHGLVTVVFMASLGYLLSVDLGSLAARIGQLCHPHHKPQPNEVQVTDKFLWRWTPAELSFHLVLLVVVGGTAALLNLLVAPSLPAQVSDYLLYAVMGLLALEYLLTELQSVYVLAGLWRNRLFPGSTQRTTIYHKGKTRLKPLGYVRRLLRNFVAPLVMLSWLAVTVSFTQTSETSSSQSANNTTTAATASSAIHVMGIHRTYRWLWQNTVCCMVDLTIYQLLRLALPATTTTSLSAGWNSLSSGLQLLLISLLRDRAEQLLHKLYLYVMLLASSWADKKQRRSSTVPTIVVNLLLLPVALSVVALASVLSAPLLPLFTLPVFFVGYPRPWRGWPGGVGASANTCADTVYYQHLAPQLARALREAAANGSIGEPAVGGHYLVRFQDRLTWVQVVERGYLYACVSIKGLELQETSCHTVEAMRIDDLFEATFEKEGGVGCCDWNPHPLNVLRPYDSVYVKTYSDARNQLTGVIDSPDSLRLIADGFVQALVWLLLHHCHEKKKRGEIYLARPTTGRTKTPLGHVGRTNSGSNWEKLDEGDGKKSAGSAARRSQAVRKQSFGLGDPWPEDNVSNTSGWEQQKKNQRNSRPLSGGGGRSRPGSAISRKSSLKSFNDSWASDNESLILEPLDTRHQRPNLVQGLALATTTTTTSTAGAGRRLGPSAIVRDESDSITSAALPPLREDRRLARLPGLLPDTLGRADDDRMSSTTDDFLNEMDFGLPAADIHQPPRRPGPESHVSFSSSYVTTKTDPRTPAQIQLTSLGESLHFATLFSRLVTPPLHWRDSPVDRRALSALLDKFPKAWYRHVISVLRYDVESSDADVASEIAKDAALEEVYRRLVMACYGLVNVFGSSVTDVVSLGATHVHKVYNGDIPWSTSVSWLQDDEELCPIVVKAFRYGVKLAVDQVLLGEASSLEELQTYMEEYDRDCYIGLETDPGWTEAILRSTPYLFSLNYIPTQGTFTSRVLSLQDVALHVGSVSAEAVRAQWANLALELLYMTNDDEERNSIQAHASLLRNLTVQAADPPLGYPVYASAPVSIPTL